MATIQEGHAGYQLPFRSTTKEQSKTRVCKSVLAFGQSELNSLPAAKFTCPLAVDHSYKCIRALKAGMELLTVGLGK